MNNTCTLNEHLRILADHNAHLPSACANALYPYDPNLRLIWKRGKHKVDLPVGLAHVVHRSIQHQASLMEQANMIRDPFHLGNLMRREEDGRALTAVRHQALEHQLDADWVQAFARLVKNQCDVRAPGPFRYWAESSPPTS